MAKRRFGDDPTSVSFSATTAVKPDPSCGGKNQVITRGLFGGVGLLVLVFTLMLLWTSGPKSQSQRIVVLATWSTNGEQVVTFRPEPPDSEITCTELVSADADGSTQPPTLRTAGGYLLPVSFGQRSNATIRYDALPSPGASIGGRPVAYTPGSYTVAYTPTASVNRLRAGVAREQTGPADWLLRCRKCWEQESIRLLRFKTHRDPVFVTSELITNGAAMTREAQLLR